MNKIHALLSRVAETGNSIGAEDWEGVLTRGSNGDRSYARRKIATAAKQIRGLLTGDLDTLGDVDDTIAEIIAETSQELGWVTTADPGAASRGPRELANEISAHTTDDIEKRRRAAMDARTRRAPLVDLLKGSGKAGGIDGRDLDALNLRADITAAERDKWRADVVAAGKRVGRLYSTGNLAKSRQLAEELGERLADQLAPTAPHRDPLRDEEDPRVLADAILARGRG